MLNAIRPLPTAARDYIRIRDLVAIVRWRDGRLGTTRDPAGAAAAWWCPAASAGLILRKAEAGSISIEEAARKLGIELIEHRALLIRARVRALGRAVANARASRGVRW